jgi:hypothetical protein
MYENYVQQTQNLGSFELGDPAGIGNFGDILGQDGLLNSVIGSVPILGAPWRAATGYTMTQAQYRRHDIAEGNVPAEEQAQAARDAAAERDRLRQEREARTEESAEARAEYERRREERLAGRGKTKKVLMFVGGALGLAIIGGVVYKQMSAPESGASE